ncbi:MAG: Stk1 family PASTA domain-containing Ser/Thr kinase [Caldicoprobacterales bacterium]|nr:Stk1 family PASTA domain-containing Ser/Thr kinase [Clostridiales bacterium]
MLGKILGGRYELIEKTGGGGMAVVYKAKCHLLKRYVAVKILRPDLVDNEEFVSRFKRESQAVASLSHPNIVNMYDVGQEGDIYYIVMEYVDGMTLKEYIRKEGRLSSEEAVRIASQICSALHHAHENNIVHRDIKPQNILINKEGVAKVADFGIARAVTSSTVTLAGANVIGSVHYFSPEQAKGSYVDKKSDIYSLGIVLYEMVTGVVPFEGDSAISVALKHIQEQVTPPGEINPDILKSVQYIIQRAIEKDIENRYHDAEEMLNDLNRALDEPDGAYVKRVSNDDQATRIIPRLSGLDEQNSGKENHGALPDEEGALDKRRGWALVTFSVIAAAAVLLVLFMVVRTIYNQNFASRETRVPRIEGQDEVAAREILKERGLLLTIEEWIYDDTVPEGRIISQNPQEGTTVKTDSKVYVIMSRGMKMIPVPDVVNQSQRNAEIELENQGLKVGQPEYINSNIASGYVVRQEPAAYREVPEGTEVHLFISKGPEENSTVVGKYTGINESVALELIKGDNLEIGNVYRELNSEYKEGIVFRQSPQQGANVEQGRKVDLWVSLGEQPIYKKKISITTGTDRSVRVKIIRTSDDKVIHDKKHNPADRKIEIIMEDTGVQSYAIWIDNEYFGTQTLDFTKQERRDE